MNIGFSPLMFSSFSDCRNHFFFTIPRQIGLKLTFMLKSGRPRKSDPHTERKDPAQTLRKEFTQSK